MVEALERREQIRQIFKDDQQLVAGGRQMVELAISSLSDRDTYIVLDHDALQRSFCVDRDTLHAALGEFVGEAEINAFVEGELKPEASYRNRWSLVSSSQRLFLEGQKFSDRSNAKPFMAWLVTDGIDRMWDL